MWPFKRKPDLFDVVYRTPMPAVQPSRDTGGRGGAMISVDNLRPYSGQTVRYAADNGEKFPGGYGATEIPIADLWTLRARSADLFERNLFARGLIRRIVENMIATGLTLEATPIEPMLGFDDDGLEEWQEDVERRFGIWGSNKRICDYSGEHTFGELQADICREALVCGDCVVVSRRSSKYKVPQVEVISGTRVQTPLGVKPRPGNDIVDGVEIDSQGRHVAYFVVSQDGFRRKWERIACYGEKTDRRIAWMVYGSDKRVGVVRGKPLLAIVLQSLKEIDRYRDSTQRKAGIGATIAGYVTQTVEGAARALGIKNSSGGFGAKRKGAALEAEAANGDKRRFDVEDYVPGVFIHTLEPGEEIKQLQNTAATEDFSAFQNAVLSAVAFCCSVPPEVFLMNYDKSFSAATAADNAFKVALSAWRKTFGTHACAPIYEEWLVTEVLKGKIKAKGLREAIADPSQYEVYYAWVSADWCGQVKPAIQLLQLVTAYERMIAQGLITRERAAMELNGSDFRKNVKKLGKENALLAIANAHDTRVDTLAKLLPPPSENGGDANDNDEEGADAKEDHVGPRTDAHLSPVRGTLLGLESRRPHRGAKVSLLGLSP
jgi:lambda family phage portal protein